MTLFKELKDKMRIVLHFLRSEALRGWIIIIITAALAWVAYHQWQAMNDNIREAHDLTQETKKLIEPAKKQAEASKMSADAAKSSAEAAKRATQIAEQSLNLERSKSKAQLEVRFWRVRNASVTLPAHASAGISSGDDRTQDANKEQYSNKSASINTSKEGDRTQIILILRNLSSRPTAVIYLYVRDKDGDYLGGNGYNDQIQLPVRVEPWGLHKEIIRIAKDDEKRMKDIFIVDMEDYEYIVPLGAKWVRAQQK